MLDSPGNRRFRAKNDENPKAENRLERSFLRPEIIETGTVSTHVFP